MMGQAVLLVGGPLLFAGLMRLPSRPGLLLALSAGVLVCAFLGLMNVFAQSQEARAEPGLTQGLVAIWLAWVLAIILVIQAIRPRITSDAGAKRLFWIGLGATFLPWLALVAAQSVGV